MSKLFNKLSEQMKIDTLKEESLNITRNFSSLSELENQLIFSDILHNLSESLNITEDDDSPMNYSEPKYKDPWYDEKLADEKARKDRENALADQKARDDHEESMENLRYTHNHDMATLKNDHDKLIQDLRDIQANKEIDAREKISQRNDALKKYQDTLNFLLKSHQISYQEYKYELDNDVLKYRMDKDYNEDRYEFDKNNEHDQYITDVNDKFRRYQELHRNKEYKDNRQHDDDRYNDEKIDRDNDALNRVYNSLLRDISNCKKSFSRAYFNAKRLNSKDRLTVAIRDYMTDRDEFIYKYNAAIKRYPLADGDINDIMELLPEISLRDARDAEFYDHDYDELL
jgi:hypothetical protein